jgi:2-dehydropantoate 2-reductase
MKILVVGAGAVGGYFGGRLLEKGEDVTFLVREGRRKQLEETGLVIESINGNVTLTPKMIVAGEEAESFDVILLSTKAYHLEEAIGSFRQYVGEETIILPLLNGILHLEKLIEEFGEERVIGGLCFLESTLDAKGRVIQSSPVHNLVFGERTGERTERILKMADAFSGTKANFRLSKNINRDQWQKYLFISTLSGITTLMRAPIGPIREETNGRATLLLLTKELVGIMKQIDAPIAEDIETIQMTQIDGLGYSMKSSMQRDMEKLLPVEADHLHGYLLEIARRKEISVPILAAVYGNLKVYEKQLAK